MDLDKIRKILNIIFILLAVAAVITFFVVGDNNYRTFLYVCGAAIFVKLIEFFIRFTN